MCILHAQEINEFAQFNARECRSAVGEHFNWLGALEIYKRAGCILCNNNNNNI